MDHRLERRGAGRAEKFKFDFTQPGQAGTKQENSLSR
jgi:hypothetical protein